MTLMSREPHRRAAGWTAGLVLTAVLAAGSASADGLLDQVPDTANDTLSTLFPNWLGVTVAAFDITVCADGACGTPTCNVTGLTIFNYGTAAGGTDLAAVSFNLSCPTKTNVTQGMTYAGVWIVGGKSRPAWTWGGDIPWGADPFSDCGTVSLRVIADVAPCPTDGATVTMGFGFNDGGGSLPQPGGMWDACGYQIPSYQEPMTGRSKTILYALKTADRTYVAPGDTVTYTLFYGRPGGPSISNVVILDTLPPATHYVIGSASKAPDPTWDPDPGPPLRLRWTLPGVPSTAGGATDFLTFQASVDWGNGESFEPGSGDSGAPEGARLENLASVDFQGSGCAVANVSNPPTSTIVRRYMMWKTADQDLLFAPRVGYPSDEITYSIFLRNESTTKTWWNVSVWDTVPAQLTPWGLNLGVWDNCQGIWTMSPTAGCSDGAPGWTLSAPATSLLTWTLNLGPGQSIELKWKAAVQGAGVTDGMTALSRVSVMALGAPRQIGGSGAALAPRTFLHLAPIKLRTTYFSYVGQAADSTSCAGLAINFYPLNKATSFELYKYYSEGAATFAGTGGKSPSIMALNGGCAGFADGGYGGCGVERAPAQYFWLDSCNAAPNAALYKLTGNAPVLWLLMPDVGGGGDALTYIPSTSLHDSGFCHYSFRRSVSGNATPGWGESWVVFNTGLDENGAFDGARATTTHIFKWDFVVRAWQYVKGGDVAGNSLWMPFAGCAPGEDDHYKIISSDNRLVVYQGYGTIGDPNITFAYNDHGGMVPTAETGLNTSSTTTGGTFYAVTHDDVGGVVNMIVGNHGSADATFRVSHYRPANPALASTGIPASLCDSRGYWDIYGNRTADGTIFGPDNPHAFGNPAAYDKLTQGTGGTANAWKVEWIAGSPLSVAVGSNPFYNWSGGSLLHPVTGQPTGSEFWFHQTSGQAPGSWAVLLFCPASGMIVEGTSSDGFLNRFTTDGPDQCIAFLDLSSVPFGGRRVYRFQLLPGGTQGPMIGMYHQPQYREKFFTAPFVSTGVHYDIIAPPVVFTGQPFWITVNVVLGSGTLMPNYTGTSSFTSTDPFARIENVAMDSYNYAWILANGGTKLFLNVTLTQLGLQSLIANDILDGSVTGLTAVVVVGADIKLTKEPRLQVAASGDVVQFKICWSNYSSASGSNFTVADAVPNGTVYVPDTPSNHFCGAGKGFGAATVAYSSTTDTPAAYAGMTGPATTAVQFLKWTIPTAGVGTTGCVCFRVTVR